MAVVNFDQGRRGPPNLGEPTCPGVGDLRLSGGLLLEVADVQLAVDGHCIEDDVVGAVLVDECYATAVLIWGCDCI